jgi:hypothetical protein
MPWKLAILGASPDALQLARVARQDPRFAITAWLEVEGRQAQLLEMAPTGVELDDWQDLLAADVADAVIVSPQRIGREQQRREQLRSLAQNETPLLLIQPACEAILAFQLDMIRSDTGAPMLAYSPGLSHPALYKMAALRDAGEHSPIGGIEQLRLERRLRDRSQENVIECLVRDVGLLRVAAGAVSRVSATAGPGQQWWTSLNVALTCGDGVLARWAVAPAGGEEGAQLTAVGSHGTAVLHMPAATESWRFEVNVNNESPTVEEIEHNSPQDALDELDRSLSSPGLDYSWPQACRDLEVASVVEESVRRGRTIPIHGAIASEENTFKGMMAVGGCAVILLLLAGTLVWAVVEGVRLARHPPSAARDGHTAAEESPAETTPILLRLWPVYPLAAFLLLQLLWLVFLGRPKQGDKSPQQRKKKPPPVSRDP